MDVKEFINKSNQLYSELGEFRERLKMVLKMKIPKFRTDIKENGDDKMQELLRSEDYDGFILALNNGEEISHTTICDIFFSSTKPELKLVKALIENGWVGSSTIMNWCQREGTFELWQYLSGEY